MTGQTPPPPPPPGPPPYGQPQYGQPQYGQPAYAQPYSAPPSGQPPYGPPPGYGPPPSRTNGLGIAAVIVGAVAVVVAVLPFVGIGGIFLGLVAAGLGVGGLFLRDRGKVAAIVGTVLGALSIPLAIVAGFVYAALFVNTVTGVIDELETGTEAQLTVVYEVTGTSTNAEINWTTSTGDVSENERVTGEPLPFTHEVTTTAGYYPVFFLYALNSADDDSEIACRITVNGQVVAEETASGSYAAVSCDADADDLG